MTTSERLENYYPFDTDVIETVSEFAEKQRSFKSYADFFDYVGIKDPVQWDAGGHLTVDILDIRPKDHDESEAMFYHLPMANPLDPNQIFQVATIAGTNPNKRIIAAGNPSGSKYNTGKLHRFERGAIKDGNFLSPLIDSLQQYASRERIENANEVGYSYGALRATVSAFYAEYAVSHMVAIEPVMGQRPVLKLGLDFASTAKELNRYVDANELDIFKEARKDSVGMLAYNRGLLRLTNLAIAKSLASADFGSWTEASLAEQRGMKVLAAWGTESELAQHDLMLSTFNSLKRSFGLKRVRTIPLKGQKHALANDIHLQAAIVAQGLKEAA